MKHLNAYITDAPGTYWAEADMYVAHRQMLYYFSKALSGERMNKLYGCSYRWRKYLERMELAFERWQECATEIAEANSLER